MYCVWVAFYIHYLISLITCLFMERGKLCKENVLIFVLFTLISIFSAYQLYVKFI